MLSGVEGEKYMVYYKSCRIVDGKPRWVIVDGRDNIVDRNPCKRELKGLEKFPEKDGRSNPRLKKSDSELLEYLRRFEKENGRIPVVNEFNENPVYPNGDIYFQKFGSWNNALNLAGIGIKPREELYTDEELLNYLKQFYEKYGRIPTTTDFEGNRQYPHFHVYERFGGWQKALKLVGLDVDTMVRKGIIETSIQKGRWFEILVKEHFENESKDLSGENSHSSCDGICPTGQKYDAKSSRLHKDGYWYFKINNEETEWYYLGAFNEDYTKLLHVWLIPWNFTENFMRIGISNNYKYTIENMKEYEITDKFLKIADKFQTGR